MAFVLLVSFQALAAFVAQEAALGVAGNYMNHIVTAFGSWNGSTGPAIKSVEPVYYNGVLLVYKVDIDPSGYMLVAAWDEFSPVLLYSAKSVFDLDRMDKPQSLESCIIGDIYQSYHVLFNEKAALSKNIDYSKSRVAKAWNWLSTKSAKTRAKDVADVKFATVGPLLSTQWGQSSPYNDMAPGLASCDHCLTGCVATAWAQILKYWEWPVSSSGSVSYYWSNAAQNVSYTFNTTYDWANMPNTVTAYSTTAQKDAVAQLMYDCGMAAQMNYGCSTSGSSMYANQALDQYFGYKSTMVYNNRSSYTASQWFDLFKTELDAATPRVMAYSIFGVDGGGHEVVVDGYQTGVTDKVHINYGWDGYSDAYYDVTQNWTAGGYTWDGSYQQVITGIEPDRDDPEPAASVDVVIPIMVTSATDVTAVKVSNIDPANTVTVNVQLIDTQGHTAELTGVDTIDANCTNLLWAAGLLSSAGGQVTSPFAAKFTFVNATVDKIHGVAVTRSASGQRSLPFYKCDKNSTAESVTFFCPFLDKTLGDSSIKLVNTGSSACTVSGVVRSDTGAVYNIVLDSLPAHTLGSYSLLDIADLTGDVVSIFSLELTVSGNPSEIFALVWQMGNNGERTMPIYKNTSTTDGSFTYF